jgi:hypothetical protein
MYVGQSEENIREGVYPVNILIQCHGDPPQCLAELEAALHLSFSLMSWTPLLLIEGVVGILEV